MIPLWPLKLIISLVAIAAMAARIWWPDLRLDAVSLGLMIVAVLPWLSDLIESAKFPGGWELKFRDLRAAAEKVIGDAPPPVTPAVREGLSEQSWAQDPSLALVGLRIEIERRLRRLAEKRGVKAPRGLLAVVHGLWQAEVIDRRTYEGLRDLIDAGNNAAHGVRFDNGDSGWVTTLAPEVLAVLDAKLAEDVPPAV